MSMIGHMCNVNNTVLNIMHGYIYCVQ